MNNIVRSYHLHKEEYPDVLLLFRCGDFYEMYQDDAVKASHILRLCLTKSKSVMDDDGNPLVIARFPHHALDAYLPKLIREGVRVAICDIIN